MVFFSFHGKPMLGVLSSPGTSTNLNSQISKLKDQFVKNKEIAKEHAAKYNELITFANVMSDGYIASMQVIVDVSSLLNSYKDLLEELNTGIAEIGTAFNTGINASELEKLKNSTENSLSKIKNVFSTEYEKLYSVISRVSGNPQFISDLNNVKALVDKIDTQTSAVKRSILAGGGRKKWPRKKQVALK